MDLSLLSYECIAITTTLLCLLLGIVITLARSLTKKSHDFPPAVPGLPFIGNLLQLKEKKPHLTFARWAEIYGPIFSIRTGASKLVVLNSAEVAKEIFPFSIEAQTLDEDHDTNSLRLRLLQAMVTKFSSISTRKLPRALELLTSNKAMVAMSDHGQFYKMARHCILTSVLGAAAQKRHRHHRDLMMENMSRALNSKIQESPLKEVNLREIFRMELFSLALKQAIGKDVVSIYVEELGKEISKDEVFEILVSDQMKGAIEIDWRDFFPYLRWIPNLKMERRIHQFVTRKVAVTRALIDEQKKRIATGEVVDCHLDFLLSEDISLTEDQLTSLVWEAIIGQSDTTLVATEWAMYELAKNPMAQEHLYQEICRVCGSQKIVEEHIPALQYLTAIFHETLRLHSPTAIIPLRYVHEDIQLGGYHVPAGTKIAINIHGCNMNKGDWDEPHRWKPERFLMERCKSTDVHKTMAFGAGKRTCTGSSQAMLITCMAIGKFVQEFEWKLVEGEDEKVDMAQFLTHKLHPMLAHIKPR